MKSPGKVVNTFLFKIQSFLFVCFLSVWGLILLEVFYKLLREYFSEPVEFFISPFYTSTTWKKQTILPQLSVTEDAADVRDGTHVTTRCPLWKCLVWGF